MTAEEVGEAKQTIPIEGEDISPKKDGGVLKIIKKEGYGEETPMIGDKVSVHYLGTLLDGTKFDSSRDRDSHFTFDLGKGQVIKAWDIGVATMKIGEVCQLICKPDYAYGSAGSPPKIPANATLVFEVELFEFKGEDLSEHEDCGIIRRILKKGEGYSKPNDGATVEVFLEGKFEGKVFDSRELKFHLGDGEALSVPVGIERAIKNMEKEEEALITLKPRYGFHTSGNPEFNIPPNATLNYVVKLKAFEKAKESWEMDITEKLEQGSIVKEKGTQYFKEGKYKQAAGQYKKIIMWLEMESGLTEEEEQKSRALQLAAHLNMAMCFLKVQELTQALESCNKALEMDSSNEKALFRRSEAYFSMKEFEEARQGFQKVVQLYPNNKAAKAQIVACQRHIKDQHEKDKRLYANMFQRFAEQDAKKEAEKVKDTKSQDIQEKDVNIEENSDEMKDEHGQ